MRIQVFAAPLAASLMGTALAAQSASTQSVEDPSVLYAKTFDAHWETLRDGYPYFELYGVDWDAERAEHRPKAIAAANPDEFAWELARLIMALPDPHVSFIPAIDTLAGRWSIPEVETRMIERHPHLLEWAEGMSPGPPESFGDNPHAYPEIIQVQGVTVQGVAEILAAGPVNTPFQLRLRWPDGTETDHTMNRPGESNVPPPEKHYGEGWLISGRVGSIGYMRIRTFSPKSATLGPDGKMTTMLRAALKELGDTEALILDFQGNGGGLVAASDPFLGNLLERTRSYRWGNSGGKKRVLRPRSPRYKGKVVAIVDERSASGGEWAPRILRDAGRARVVGGRTVGAEAAVLKSEGPDGSVVNYSGWPMVEPGVTPFQETGIEVDVSIPLTLEAVRANGLDAALEQVQRERFRKALELLGAAENNLEALLELASEADDVDPETVTEKR